MPLRCPRPCPALHSPSAPLPPPFPLGPAPSRTRRFGSGSKRRFGSGPKGTACRCVARGPAPPYTAPTSPPTAWRAWPAAAQKLTARVGRVSTCTICGETRPSFLMPMHNDSKCARCKRVGDKFGRDNDAFLEPAHAWTWKDRNGKVHTEPTPFVGATDAEVRAVAHAPRQHPLPRLCCHPYLPRRRRRLL